MSFFPILFNLPIMLLPVHIAFPELIIDPACSIVFEACPDEKNIMDRPPRNPEEPLFSKKVFIFSLLQGLGILIVVFLVFRLALYLKKGEIEARTLTDLLIALASGIVSLLWFEGFKALQKNKKRF